MHRLLLGAVCEQLCQLPLAVLGARLLVVCRIPRRRHRGLLLARNGAVGMLWRDYAGVAVALLLDVLQRALVVRNAAHGGRVGGLRNQSRAAPS